MQTPVMTTGQVVKQAQTDLLVAAIRAWQKLVLDLLLAQQATVVPGGFTLTANTGAPIQVNDTGGTVVLSGYDVTMAAGSYTFTAADTTYHRYDLMTIAYSQASGTDSSGAPTLVDTGTRTVIKGVANASPSVPATPAGSVTVGWLDIPPGATSATTCTIHAVLGPLAPNNLQDLTNHIAAVFNQASALHGFLITTPGGTQHGSIAQTDNANGAVGAANSLVDTGGTARTLAVPGASLANGAASYDGSGRVYDSERLGGVAPSGYQPAGSYDAGGAAAAVQTNLNSHTGASAVSGTVHGIRIEAANTATAVTDGSGNAVIAVTFATPFNTVPTVVPGLVNQKPGNASVVVAESVTVNGFNLAIGFASNSGSTVQGCYFALGT